MRIHCLQHIEYETPGFILKWIETKGYSITYTKFFSDKYKYPDLSEFDFLLIMGGPMGVYEQDKYKWIEEEKRFILKSIKNNKIVLGICLGAQLIAAALGKKVYKNRYTEIGWFPVRLTPAAKENVIFKGLPDEIVVFHWHGDTFDIPENSIHIAESEAAKNQAFLYNNKVLGLQFHFEITTDIVSGWMSEENLKPDKFIQDKDYIIKNSNKFAPLDNMYMNKLLDNLIKIN